MLLKCQISDDIIEFIFIKFFIYVTSVFGEGFSKKNIILFYNNITYFLLIYIYTLKCILKEKKIYFTLQFFLLKQLFCCDFFLLHSL